MLMDLPVVAAQPPQKSRVRWQAGVAVLLILLGIGVGCAGNTIVSLSSPDAAKTAAIASRVAPPQPAIQQTCGGFYYTVRPGDGLYNLAWQFYGNSALWQKIIEINSQLKERPDNLQVDEVILIPNREEACL